MAHSLIVVFSAAPKRPGNLRAKGQPPQGREVGAEVARGRLGARLGRLLSAIHTPGLQGTEAEQGRSNLINMNHVI